MCGKVSGSGSGEAAMDLDGKTAAVHLSEFVERNGLYIHHRRDGANRVMTIRCCQMKKRVADFFQWRTAA